MRGALPQTPPASSSHDLLPTAPELLAACPNLVRLCESYHNARRRIVERGRRQRLGLAGMVCGLAVTATTLMNSGGITHGTLSLLMIVAGLASAVGLGVLALLWLREDARLRDAQGDRLLRALQFNCSLPAEALAAFRGAVHPTVAFFDVYTAWRMERAAHPTGIAGLLASVTGRRDRGTATA